MPGTTAETKKLQKKSRPDPDPEPPEETKSATGGDTSELAALTASERRELDALRIEAKSRREGEKVAAPEQDVEPISDGELHDLLKKCGRLLFDRNRSLEMADRKKKVGDHDAAERLVLEAEALERKAVPIAADIACVPVERISHKTRRDKDGKSEVYARGINVRDGIIRIVLDNSARLKVDIGNIARAKWDYVHDTNGSKGKVANRPPARWRGRKQLASLR